MDSPGRSSGELPVKNDEAAGPGWADTAVAGTEAGEKSPADRKACVGCEVSPGIRRSSSGVSNRKPVGSSTAVRFPITPDVSLLLSSMEIFGEGLSQFSAEQVQG